MFVIVKSALHVSRIPFSVTPSWPLTVWVLLQFMFERVGMMYADAFNVHSDSLTQFSTPAKTDDRETVVEQLELVEGYSHQQCI